MKSKLSIVILIIILSLLSGAASLHLHPHRAPPPLPASSRAIVEERVTMVKEAGIGGVYAWGNTSEPICQVEVRLNRVGLVLLGGLNPVVAAVEAGIEIESIAESELIDFQQLISLWQL